MSFRPEGHERYTVSNYLKFEEGANKIRILKEPINGYEYWVFADGQIVPRGTLAGKGGKPIRMRGDAGPFSQEQISAMKMFAAMVVWNYNAEKVQILQLTQSSIMNALDGLYDSKAWGNITGYDIVINKKKTGPEPMNVEYSVLPEPKAKVSKKILEAYDGTINLEALFEGDDPFSNENTDKIDLDEVDL